MSEVLEKLDRLIKYYVRTGNWFTIKIKIIGYRIGSGQCFMQLETSEIVSVCVTASAMESSVKCPKPDTVII